jgi:hypothetical protein
MLNGKRCCLAASRQAQFLKDMADVIARCFFADEERLLRV